MAEVVRQEQKDNDNVHIESCLLTSGVSSTCLQTRMLSRRGSAGSEADECRFQVEVQQEIAEDEEVVEQRQQQEAVEQ